MNILVNNAPKYVENQPLKDFVLVEISLGMTFMDVARGYHQREHQRRAELRAETAYRSALRFLPRLEITDRERIEITSKLNVLRARLATAGVLASANLLRQKATSG